MDATDQPTPQPSSLGLGLAITWLVLGTLGCLGSVVLLLAPEVGANVSVITIPVFVSGWAAVGAAMVTRKRDARLALLAPLGGAVAGLVLGVVLTLVAYTLIWPGFI